MSIALVAVAAALVLLGRSPDRAGRRLAGRKQRAAARGRVMPRPALPALAATAVAALGAVYSFPVGAIASLTLAPLAYLAVQRLERRPVVVNVDRAAVPLVLDLLAAALRTGAPISTALAVVATDAPASIADPLRRTAALVQLGASGPSAWAPLRAAPDLAAIGVLAARSADSGIRLADALARRGDVVRQELQAEGLARAQRVGVFALLPLGLCFLPAFVCLGIVPVIAGVAHQVLGRGGP